MVNFNNDILSTTDLLFLYSLNNSYINTLLDSITTDNYQEIKDEIKDKIREILEKNIKEVEDLKGKFLVLNNEFIKLNKKINSVESNVNNNNVILTANILNIKDKFIKFKKTIPDEYLNVPILQSQYDDNSNTISLNNEIENKIKECNDLSQLLASKMGTGGKTVKKNLLKKRFFSKKRKFKKKEFNF